MKAEGFNLVKSYETSIIYLSIIGGCPEPLKNEHVKICFQNWDEPSWFWALLQKATTPATNIQKSKMVKTHRFCWVVFFSILSATNPAKESCHPVVASIAFQQPAITIDKMLKQVHL